MNTSTRPTLKRERIVVDFIVGFNHYRKFGLPLSKEDYSQIDGTAYLDEETLAEHQRQIARLS